MKKLLLFAVVLSAASFTSCTKDYTCECTILSQTTEYEFQDVKKSEAEEGCDALTASASIVGGKCELK
jgi:hypothetical protein